MCFVMCIMVEWVCGFVVIFVLFGNWWLMILSGGFGRLMVWIGRWWLIVGVFVCVCMNCLMIWFLSEWKLMIISCFFCFSNDNVVFSMICRFVSFWLMWICIVWKVWVVGFLFFLWVLMMWFMIWVSLFVVLRGLRWLDFVWWVISVFVIWKVNCFFL